MKFLKDLFNVDRIALANENEKIRQSKKNLECEFREYKDNTQELKDKYIALLEEKTKGFDLYIKYEEKCVEFANKNRELKKELALANENLTKQNQTKKEKKLNNQNEKK